MAGKKAKGRMSKTRALLKKGVKEKKLTVRRQLQSFEPEEKVVIRINSSVHSGMPHRRFNGLTGIVEKKQGACFRVKVNKKKKPCLLVVNPIHLHKIHAPSVAAQQLQDKKNI